MSREIFVGVADLMMLATTLISIGDEKCTAVPKAWLL